MATLGDSLAAAAAAPAAGGHPRMAESGERLEEEKLTRDRDSAVPLFSVVSKTPRGNYPELSLSDLASDSLARLRPAIIQWVFEFFPRQSTSCSRIEEKKSLFLASTSCMLHPSIIKMTAGLLRRFCLSKGSPISERHRSVRSRKFHRTSGK